LQHRLKIVSLTKDYHNTSIADRHVEVGLNDIMQMDGMPRGSTSSITPTPASHSGLLTLHRFHAGDSLYLCIRYGLSIKQAKFIKLKKTAKCKSRGIYFEYDGRGEWTRSVNILVYNTDNSVLECYRVDLQKLGIMDQLGWWNILP
jgi:hypothetical protein